MRRIVLTAMMSVSMLLLAACSGYNFSQATYDAVKTQNNLNSTPAERLGQPDLNYQQYDYERKRQQ